MSTNGGDSETRVDDPYGSLPFGGLAGRVTADYKYNFDTRGVTYICV